MATTHLDSGGGYTDQSFASNAGIIRRPLFPTIRWGAVFAGVAVGVSVQLVLTLLGIASGLSAIDVAQGESIGAGTLLWAGASMLISAFVGGYVAARMTGLKRKVDGVLHGVVAWAVTTLLFASLATSASGSMVSGIFGNITPNNSATAGASGGTLGGVLGMLRSQIGGNVSPAAMKTLQDHIQAGRRDDAIRHMMGSMGVDKERAETIVDQALILSGSAEQASPQSRAAADRAIGVASTAAWTAFLTVALSLAMGIAGGAMGAVGARRTTWSDVDDMARHPM
ncbi:MAG: hypothetical protein A3I66_22340 [Burkholderiales bacterium RIFCSPLOWO2_02_FULL_57_36]|nr:MAG: hypothetical protein A3I66_22340 [Burkholderiales bacterium RIFCSPLOWO2_02_FULL_57_36]